MDWSLVLASQGIETTIEPPGEEHGWMLLVACKDSERAFQNLRQYRVENRGWPWLRPLSRNWGFEWSSIGWALVMILFYWLSSIFPQVFNGGIMDSTKVISGQWWRVFTAMSLHADIAHLATNLTIGILLVGLAMGRYQAGTGLFAAYLAGAFGNLLSLLVNVRPFRGLGASGMIMGALGLLAAQSFAHLGRSRPPVKHLFAGVAAGFMLFVLFGLSPGTDIAAHVGGFIGGLLIGAIWVLLPDNFRESPKTNIGSGAVLLALVVWTWGMALHK
ncbi:MAG TPA: rhomboid family intramembrane serine protease [Verrucomicrobiae bacterium]|nr:rhomboid family intramembrane serine protease [Verrucomicrobiae bacterium]